MWLLLKWIHRHTTKRLSMAIRHCTIVRAVKQHNTCCTHVDPTVKKNRRNASARKASMQIILCKLFLPPFVIQIHTHQQFTLYTSLLGTVCVSYSRWTNRPACFPPTTWRAHWHNRTGLVFVDPPPWYVGQVWRMERIAARGAGALYRIIRRKRAKMDFNRLLYH